VLLLLRALVMLMLMLCVLLRLEQLIDRSCNVVNTTATARAGRVMWHNTDKSPTKSRQPD